MIDINTDRLTAARQIRMDEYDYPLPNARIAQYPLRQRDQSKLLLYHDSEVRESIFARLPDFLPEKSLVVFNNTRVIRARLLFAKETGAQIEIFCLEPDAPRDYASNFQSRGQCRWLCLIGNLKRWKDGRLHHSLFLNGETITLTAERQSTRGDVHCIQFSWNNQSYTFADILDAAGALPIPPYLHRQAEPSDLQTYQTVYSKVKGSVAAPTAGLHFTSEILQALDDKGIKREEVTLHVGAGTFRPVQTDAIGEHEMHGEYISVDRSTIENLQKYAGRITAVGTTSVRTLESLYHIGVKLSVQPDLSVAQLAVEQWTPYEKPYREISTDDALQNIVDYLQRNDLQRLITSTRIIIVPGYEFRMVNNLITNFHQPKSTLLLLVSAFVKENWRMLYDYALGHDFRFLSYGDSSLLLGQ